METIAKKVLCIGECMVELSPAGEALLRQDFAGDSYNTATYLTRQFAPEIEVSYLTGLGTTGLSLAMLNRFAEEGINCDHVRKLDGENPGLYMIENDETGERYFQYWRGQSAAKKMFAGSSVSQLVKEFSQFDAIYLSGISLAILSEDDRTKLFDALEQVKANTECLIAFDPNYRPALWANGAAAAKTVQTMAKLTSLALVTLDDDVEMLGREESAQDIAKRWLDWGAREVVVKHGAADCLIISDGEETQVSPEKKLSPVDTTGAGDSFAAGYVGARLLGGSAEYSAAMAHKVAGQVIMHPGGVIAREVWRRVE